MQVTIFLCFLYKESKQDKIKIKQDKNKVKRLGVRDSSCRSNSASPATAPEKVLDACKVTRPLGTPRGRYDECSSKFSLSTKPRFIEPVGSQRCSEGVGGGM